MSKKLFIDGRWIEAAETRPLYSPYDGGWLADVPYAGEAEADAAIDAAFRAKREMRQLPAHRRADILRNVARLMEARAEECALVIAREAAKPLKAARQEVQRTIMTYTFASEEARRICGETLPLDAAPGGEGRIAYTVREPLGVIGAITPFNFPMNLVAHKVGPAIAAGNAVVLKPASQTPLSALLLAELFQEAGLPAGALNVVTGSGGLIGDKLVGDARVNMITFTGSPAVGAAIRAKAGLKKVTLELGSNSALIVDGDADIDETAIARAVGGAFANSGQVCISIQRIYVHEAMFASFVKRFVEATQRLKTGDPVDAHTDVSAMIHARETERAVQWVAEAQALGAEVACGGQAIGGVMQPTVLLHVPPQANVSCQEVFAPVVLINRVASLEEAIRQVNDSRFGLQAGVYTRDIRKALMASEALEVGGVLINDIPTFRVDHMPYGGVKESGTGREGVKYAVEEMTELKLVIMAK